MSKPSFRTYHFVKVGVSKSWSQSLINEKVAVQDGAGTRAFETGKDELLLPRRRITV